MPDEGKILISLPGTGVVVSYASQIERDQSLRLAQSRQAIAERTGYIPAWDMLNEEDQETAILEARNWLRAAVECGLAVRPSVPLIIQADAVCGGTVPDSADPEFYYDCGNHSRFVVERSDGDKSFGEDGREEACPDHLAGAVTGMIDGDENIRAIVSIRWNAPEGETG